MSRRDAPGPPDLAYNGVDYRIEPDAVADLLARGVIVAAQPGGAPYELSVEHTIDELEGVAEVVDRSAAPRQPRLRVVRRNAGFSTGEGFLMTRKDDISIEDDPDA